MTDHIVRLLEEKFSEPGFDDCYLVELQLSPSKKLEVFVDSDSGLTLEKCQRISRHLESYIDENGWLGEKYVIEVSSPGTSRPLKLWRQYKKNIGRTLEVKLDDGAKVEGQLLKVDEEKIEMEVKERVEGKKKHTLVNKEFPFSSIKKAKVKISFK